jgi:hypothetical protein
MRKNRCILCLSLLLLVLVPCPLLQAQVLKAHLQADRLFVTAPQLHFLNERILERLHNGAAVPFHFQLAAVPVSGGKPLVQASDRFVLSFDLWEERFSVVQSNGPRRGASHLSSSAAEAWCLENLALPVSALAAEKSFVLKLDIRAEEPEEESVDSGGLSLTGLIDVFSRKAKEQPLRWSAVTGSIRLEDLKQENQSVRRPMSNVRRQED